jgi:Mn2+/Fe2+ NRAMP family transporter
VLVVCNNKKVMGTHRNGRILNILGGAGVVLMSLAAIALIVSWL